jgi:hypothetical protein
MAYAVWFGLFFEKIGENIILMWSITPFRILRSISWKINDSVLQISQPKNVGREKHRMEALLDSNNKRWYLFC